MKTVCAGCSGTIMSFFLSFRHKIFLKYLVTIDLTVYRISRNVYYLLEKGAENFFIISFSIFMFLLFKTSLVIGCN